MPNRTDPLVGSVGEKRSRTSRELLPSGKGIPTLKALVLVLLQAGAGGIARADHALLQDGRALFNVRVVDVQSTASGPLQVIFRPESFGYNFYTDTTFLARGPSVTHKIADFVTTTAILQGKSNARQLMLERNWPSYSPPPPRTIPSFQTLPPTPIPTPTPEATPPQNVAEASLPIEQRIQRQLDIFIKEQMALAEQLKVGTEAEAGKKQRLELLQNQISILNKYYPTGDDLVARAREALAHQQDVVKETGKFGFEKEL